jgi:AcrR family transcriptional regulator
MLTKEEIIREEVITTAQRLFQRYGFSKTTMEDIAKAMGRGKSTLYYYYKSKDEIFEAVILKEADEVFSTVTKAMQEASSAEGKLQTYLKTSFDILKSKMNLYGAIKGEVIDEDNVSFCRPSMGDSLKQYNLKERQMVKELLLFGIENKEFTPDLKDNIDLVAYTVITALRSIASDLVFNEKDMNYFFEVDKINAMITILLRGLKC